MRFLVRVLVVFVVLWCLWWVLASWGAQRGLTGAFEARESDGWRASVAQSGFPFRIRSELSDVVLTAPEGRATLQADALRISVPTHWPGDLRVELPETPMVVGTRAGPVEIVVADGVAGVRLTPDTTLPLDRVHATSGAITVSYGGQSLLSARSLLVTADRSPDDPLRHDVQVQVADLAPGAMIREGLALEEGWPQAFEVFEADLAVTFDRALDRFAVEGSPPQPRAIEVHGIDVRWGEVDMRADGALDIDPSGELSVELTAQFPDWRRQVELAYGTGLLDPGTRGTAELLMAAMANRAGSPDDLDLVVTFSGGRMSVIGIDLGPAPRIRFE